jgi:lauroyl/myristoyl acyltransferase
MEGHLRDYFPWLEEKEVCRRGAAFVGHYRKKLAEDIIAVNLPMQRMDDFVDRNVELNGTDHLFQAVDQGRGVILASAHIGSPSLNLWILGKLFCQIPAARRPRGRACVDEEVWRYPKALAAMKAVAQGYSFDVDFTNASQPKGVVARELADTLLQAGALSTNLDVMNGGRGRAPLPLFDGASVVMSALVGAAKVALRTGCMVVPYLNVRRERGFQVHFERPIGPLPRLGAELSSQSPELKQLVGTLRGIVERWILLYPEQWLYWDRFHRRLVQSPRAAVAGVFDSGRTAHGGVEEGCS